MSAFGGKADIEAKLLTKDEARRIAANIAKPAGVIVSASKGARAESGYPRSYPTDFDRDT